MTGASMTTAPGGAPEGTLRLERMADLESRVGLKKSQLWKLIREGRFPAPIKCGRSSLFIAAEVDGWIQARIRESRPGVP
jgi:predicted DNA-binding transcriptional regulator AlpA